MRLKLQSASRIKETKFRRSPSKFYLKLVLPLRPLKSWKAYNCNLTGNRWRTLEHLVPTTRKYPFDVVNRFTFCFFHGCSNISSAKILPKSTHYAKRDFFPPLPPLFPLPSLPSWPLTFLNSVQYSRCMPCTVILTRLYYLTKERIQFEILPLSKRFSRRNISSFFEKKVLVEKNKFEWKLVFEIEILNWKVPSPARLYRLRLKVKRRIGVRIKKIFGCLFNDIKQFKL